MSYGLYEETNWFLKIGFWVFYFNALLVHYFLLLLNRRRMKGKAWENFKRLYMRLMVFREGKKLIFGFGILVLYSNTLIVHIALLSFSSCSTKTKKKNKRFCVWVCVFFFLSFVVWKIVLSFIRKDAIFIRLPLCAFLSSML